jgi:hypothetical protein
MCSGQMWTVIDQDLSTFVFSLCGVHTSLCRLLDAKVHRPPCYTTTVVLLMQSVVCIASRLTSHRNESRSLHN